MDEIGVLLTQWSNELWMIPGVRKEVKHVLVLGEFDVHDGDCDDSVCSDCGCCKHCSTRCPCIAGGCDNEECMCKSLEND